MRTLAGILLAAGLALTPAYKASTCDDCQTSLIGKVVLRQLEGYMPICYKDSGGRYTLGYGHLMQSGEHCATLLPDQAENLLENDLRPKERAINTDLIYRTKKQTQFDSLILLVFNIGEYKFQQSHLLKAINTGESINQIEPLWLEWDKVSGVTNKGLSYRRGIEFSLYSL